MYTLRPNQKPPKKKWRFWSIIAGRGFGKTLAGAHCLVNFIKNNTKQSIGLIGHTIADVKNIMIYGPSGILHLMELNNITYKFQWKDNKLYAGTTTIYIFSGDRYDKLRGFQLDCIWADELAKFRDPQQLINQMIFATRLGFPQFIITTTPRPLAVFEFLKKQSLSFFSEGSSYENKNLPHSYIDLIDQWKKTPMGRQEIFGEILNTNPSPWAQYSFDYDDDDHWINHVLSVDPSVVAKGHTTGIIWAAYNYKTEKFVVIDDFSIQSSVENWINRVVKILQTHKIKNLIIETNQGGDLLEYAIKNQWSSVNITKVFATHDKYSRSMATAQLYWNDKIVHSKPLFFLEEQLQNFSGTLDRVDGLVWAIEYLSKMNHGGSEPVKFWSCH
jgi:phage terminase large subunit-like protein